MYSAQGGWIYLDILTLYSTYKQTNSKTQQVKLQLQKTRSVLY